MADIMGALGLPDNDYAFINTLGQEVVYNATLQVLGDHNADLDAMMRVFVEKDTWDHTVRYKLPMEGTLQKKRTITPAMLSRPSGSWDVSFPLEEYGDAIAWDRVGLAYMTVGQYNLALEGVLRKDRNTRRTQALNALFSPTARTFVDEAWGSLTIQPLANGDSVVYPPVIGSFAETTANNYLASGYAYTAISDTNDPIPTMVNALEQYLGTPTGGSKIAIFCNNEETQYLQGLTKFDPVPNRFVAYGVNTSLVPYEGVPDRASIEKFPLGLPGRVLGETDSALLVEWRWIPAGYLFGVHLDAPQPLRKRIDPPETGLGTGLMLTSQSVDEPLRFSEWSCRFGFGVANRLNGVAMQLTTGSYTAPTIAGT